MASLASMSDRSTAGHTYVRPQKVDAQQYGRHPYGQITVPTKHRFVGPGRITGYRGGGRCCHLLLPFFLLRGGRLSISNFRCACTRQRFLLLCRIIASIPYIRGWRVVLRLLIE